MRLSIILIFLHGICFWRRDFTSSKEWPWRQDNSWNKKQYSCRNTICEQTQYILNEVKPHHHFFCITFALNGKIPLLKNDVCFVLLFHSYGRAYCIHATMSLPKSIKYYIHTLLLHNNDSLYHCIFFSQLVHCLIKVYRKFCAYWRQHVL